MKNKLFKKILLFVVLVSGTFSFAQTVRGKVTSGGITLPGVNVFVKGSSEGVSTDFDGTFTINKVPSGSILVVSFVGYVTKEVVADANNPMEIVLYEESKTLNEVVVVGYGTSKRKDLTGSVSTIKASDLQDQPFTSVDQALVGKAAGVTVSQNSGAPGGGVAIKIRGITSINGNEPLYVIDGTPLFADRNNTSLDLGSATGGGAGQNNNSALAGLNMSDIETIDILKDASATAIYGANGSNGVVLITTKKGKKGKGIIAYDTYTGMQTVAKTYDVMDLQQFARYTNDFSKLAGQPVPFEFENPDLLGKGTDWQKEIFRSALITNHQFSFSGEKEGTRYYTSLGYFNQEGIIVNSDFERLSLRLNIDTKVNSWLKIGNNISISNVKQRIVKNDDRGGIVSSAIRLSPGIPVTNTDGTFGGAQTNSTIGSAQFESVNPVAYSAFVNNLDQKFKVNGNLFGDMSITKSLVFRSELGYDLNGGNGRIFIPTYGNIGSSANTVNKSIKRQDQSYYWSFKNYLTYNKILDKHSINVVLGQEAQKSNYEFLFGSRQGFANNDYDNLILGNKAGQELDNQSYRWAMASYLSRVNYNFGSKYYLTASLRADASSNFSPNNRWGYFPSVSAAWTVSNENFMKSISAINYLKLRVGYGLVGNQNIPANLFENLLDPINTSTGDLAFLFSNTAGFNIKWESLRSTNIGFELGLLDDAIKLDVDFYEKRSSDLLVPRPSTIVDQGRRLPFENNAEMVNRGIDIALNTRNISNDNFSWNSTVIFTTFSNKLTKFYEGSPQKQVLIGNIPQFDGDNVYSLAQSGEALGQIYGYVTDGIFRTQQEVNDSPKQNVGTSVGDIKFKDLNGDGVIDTKDKTYIGSAIPKFSYSFNNNFKYKNLDLRIVLQGTYGNKIYNQNRFYTEGLRFLGENQSTNAINHFVVKYIEGTNQLDDAANLAQNTDVPRIDRANSNSNTRVSDRFVEDGSYLRIQNVTLGYTMPTSWVEKSNFFSRVKLYAAAQNLFTFTKYTGLDPEVGSRNSDIKLSGLDVGRYPVARTFTLGLNLDF
jgi:TonB-dependent starch-binding outer membrane protein SusC